ncbi:methylmalonyl-CoA mutase [candidate division WOR_3 bacterium SM23_60]|uniref:Methylmalonyl-CoA mutase n=1 Tax=candidate division WOR_3 bacterium SM23_60 TaxID=1703780 RepID=A0A0S8GFG1_UNCW3|nr:MAG: methylmalonyl-CoA mutase [candidate division WOR_3 bacterium SM23_60]
MKKDIWEKKVKTCKERDDEFTTVSGIPINPLYTPLSLQNFDYDRDLGYPGEFPFVRGVYSNMYRGRLWTMRQFSGFGTPKDTNRRYKYLLKHGQTGLSVAFDFPTLYGRDSDDPFSHGEVGKCGVAIDTLRDMEILFADIPLDQISTSMTINPPASMLLAMYIVVGEKQGIPPNVLTGTIQNDMLKEYQAQKTWIYPPEPSMRIITDIMAYCSKHVPKWNTISISGYHIREAGSTALQELAFTLKNGFTYVEYGMKAGLDVDRFAPRLSFFFNSHLDFFEEIAKYRAARRIWARLMQDKYNAQNPRSYLMRFHTQTAGCTLTAQQPENNIMRTAFQALSAVLGGTQSLHTNSMDETYALPTEKAVKIALRTQQLIAYETGVSNTIDPLGGAYFVEALTNQLEKGAYEYFQKIDRLGGVVAAIEKGFFQREISRSAYTYQKKLEQQEKYHVGVNIFTEEEKPDIEILKIPKQVELDQKKALRNVKKERNSRTVKQTLKALRTAAANGENLMPRLLDCVRAYATLGEMCSTLKEEFGEYKEPIIF